MPLQLVTFNLAGTEQRWREERREVTIRALKELSPDVLCLQEVTKDPLRDYDQVTEIGLEIGLAYSAFCSYGSRTREVRGERGGIAVLSRTPFQSVDSFKLPQGIGVDETERKALAVKLEFEGRVILVMVTHLSWHPLENDVRKRQCEALEELLKLYRNVPRILAGDFNAEPGEPSISEISLRDSFKLLHPGEAGATWTLSNPLTMGSDRGDCRIDYIFCDENFRVLDSRIVLNAPGPVYPSDHFGLLSRLELL